MEAESWLGSVGAILASVGMSGEWLASAVQCSPDRVQICPQGLSLRWTAAEYGLSLRSSHPVRYARTPPPGFGSGAFLFWCQR